MAPDFFSRLAQILAHMRECWCFTLKRGRKLRLADKFKKRLSLRIGTGLAHFPTDSASVYFRVKCKQLGIRSDGGTRTAVPAVPSKPTGADRAVSEDGRRIRTFPCVFRVKTGMNLPPHHHAACARFCLLKSNLSTASRPFSPSSRVLGIV